MRIRQARRDVANGAAPAHVEIAPLPRGGAAVQASWKTALPSSGGPRRSAYPRHVNEQGEIEPFVLAEESIQIRLTGRSIREWAVASSIREVAGPGRLPSQARSPFT